MFIKLKVCQRKTQNNESLFFINYSFQKQSLMNTNPFTEEMQLYPGTYLILPILKIEPEGFKKKFSVRLAVMLQSFISMHEFVLSKKSSNFYIDLIKSSISIKLIVSKCCACEETLREFYMISNSKVFCLLCYNSIFRCAQCDQELGNDYFTIENKLICLKCSEKYL